VLDKKARSNPNKGAPGQKARTAPSRRPPRPPKRPRPRPKKPRYPLAIIRAIKNGFAARLGGVETKEQADALRGVQLFARRDQLPSLPDDEFYHADLIGLEVRDTGGTLLGQVRSVQNHGATDLLEIHGPDLRNTVLLPFTRAAVPTVDLASGRIVADPPDGLF
jgi:16S rRNA processing protein RimM